MVLILQRTHFFIWKLTVQLPPWCPWRNSMCINISLNNLGHWFTRKDFSGCRRVQLPLLVTSSPSCVKCKAWSYPMCAQFSGTWQMSWEWPTLSVCHHECDKLWLHSQFNLLDYCFGMFICGQRSIFIPWLSSKSVWASFRGKNNIRGFYKTVKENDVIGRCWWMGEWTSFVGWHSAAKSQ